MTIKKAPTPITAEHKVVAIKNCVRKTAIQMDPGLCGSFAGDALIGQLLGMREFEHYRVDLTLAQTERVFKLFLDACAFVPDIRRLEKGVIPDGRAIMARIRKEHAEREKANKRAVNMMANASGLA